ncbi:MAG: glycosyl hydrolase [Flavobacteriaceae bacterium]
MKKNLLLFCILMTSVWGYSQQLTWTGNAANNDFFDEANWQDTNTSLPPASGTIDANQAVNLDLQLHNVNTTVMASGIISLGTGSLSVTNSSLQANAFSGGSVSINTDGYVDLSAVNPFQNNVSIDFVSGIGWIRTLNKKGVDINNDNLGQITVNGSASVYESNLRLDNYYFEGTVIRSNNLSTTPLTLYDNSNLQGTSASLSLDIIHSGSGIPNTMDNKGESFVLKKGYMATFAINEDGTGKSKNYIASEADLIINEFPNYLLNDVSFIRVIPWNWVTKKGINGPVISSDLNNTWNYRWANTGVSSIDVEYAPMSFGRFGANQDSDIDIYTGKYKATHVLGFNEADNCNAQGGVNGFCDTDVAVDHYKRLVRTGLRTVSPSCTESAGVQANGWLKEFYDKANALDIRIDVIGVHWYDWGNNPATNTNPTPQSVFNRFVTYLEDIYNLYGLPIWITEFNANPNRSNAINYAFMQLALPYLETLDYVERYCWFEPSSGTADFYEADGTTLTNVGNFYKNQVSTSAVPETTITEDSNLDIYYNLTNPSGNNLLVNGDFETGDLTGWNGSNTGILSSPNANVYDGTTTGRILANAGNISQTITLESLEEYDLSFYTKWFVAPPSPITIQILNANDDTVIASKVMTTSTDWNLVELSFMIPAGVTSVKFYVEKGASSPGWFIDNALLIKSTTLALDEFDLNVFRVYPNPSQGTFTLKGKTSIQSFTIFDIHGRLIQSAKNMNSNEVNIQLNNKSKGLYLIKLEDIDGNISSKKIIIN